MFNTSLTGEYVRTKGNDKIFYKFKLASTHSALTLTTIRMVVFWETYPDKIIYFRQD